MERKIESVPVGLISLKARKYQFSVPLSIKPLIHSIDQNGIIHPVVLTRNVDSDTYTVVCGYKRVLAAMKLGISKVEAIAPQSKSDDISLFYLNITDTMCQRELHFIENGNVLRMLLKCFNSSREELVNTHMKRLGLKPSGFLLDRLISISSFESSVKRFIVKHKIPLHVSEHFLRFTAVERLELVRVLSRLRFGTNKVKEFLTFIKEISIRDDIPPLNILERFGLKEVIEGRESSSAEAGATVRAILYKNRFPVTETLEAEFQTLVGALALPNDISISHSKNFEESTLKLSLSLKDPRRIADLSRVLMELDGKEQFEKLFDL